MTTGLTRLGTFMAAGWPRRGAGLAVQALLPKNQSKTTNLAAQKTQPPAAMRERHLSAGIMTRFDDNELNGIVAVGLNNGRARMVFDWNCKCRR
jgi:hypothetical protein